MVQARAVTSAKRGDANETAHIRIDIPRTFSPEQGEFILKERSAWPGETIKLRLPSSFAPGLLNDIWATILVGTLCRNHAVTAIPAGLQKLEMDCAFIRSLHGITALHSAAHAAFDKKVQGSIPETTVYVNRVEQLKGRLEVVLDHKTKTINDCASTLIEFDPSTQISSHIKGHGTSVNPSLLERLAQTFNDEQHFLLKRSHIAAEAQIGEAAIGTFCKELYLNSYEYARNPTWNGRNFHSTRFFQLSTIQPTASVDQLTSGLPPALRDYVANTFRRRKGSTLMRLAVSDFGDGMLDYFLKSERGEEFRSRRRLDVLQQLIHTSLSSKLSVLGAGYGLNDVMSAAKQLGAFASLRTNEFWLGVSYLNNEAISQMEPMLEIDPTQTVAGTHWQIMWPIEI